jgi:hypothetical protein
MFSEVEWTYLAQDMDLWWKFLVNSTEPFVCIKRL